MTQPIMNMETRVLVAVDIAKARNDVLVELPNGSRRKFKVANKLEDYQKFVSYLTGLKAPCLIGFEATGNYHRPLAHYLGEEGFALCLVSSLAAAKTREALYNSWDKNDPKDAQVILHMMKTGVSQIYCDPMAHNTNETQELSKTYYQVSLRKVKVQHSMMTHYLPLYFPEAQKYFHSSRAEWFSNFLLRFTVPAIVLKYTKEDFISAAWDTTGRKVSKRAWLSDFYETARHSIGIPVPEDSEAVRMFRLVLEDHIGLCKMRQRIEQQAQVYMGDNADYYRLQTIPGIGPITALTILAETGDMRRFSHYKKFLKYCGLDLSTEQSGRFRGISKLSKRGNSRLRLAFWVAATVAIRMRENTFRHKYERYICTDPANKDLKRKAYTAVAAKMARVAYSVIKTGTDYRCFHETAIPSGKIPSPRAVEAILTS
jgi:transposase